MSATMQTRELDRLSRSGLSTADIENLDQDLSGRTVYDRTGEEIGSVEDLLVDTVRLQAPFVVVSWGGLLGIGRQQRLIPVEAIDRVTPQGIYLEADKEQVTTAPSCRDDISGADAVAHYAEVYDVYGIAPSAQTEQPVS